MGERLPRVMARARYERLLARAAREFATMGYDRSSLNDVIRDCGISKSSFYHYFASKDELFDIVVSEAATALAERLQPPDPGDLAGPNFWKQISVFVHHATKVVGERAWYSDLGKLFYLPDARALEIPALSRISDQIAAWLGSVLKVGRESGQVRDDLPRGLQTELVVALLQAMDRWSLKHLDELEGDALDQLTTLEVAALQRLLKQ